MGFVVLPALIPDIAPVYDVYFAAFKDNPVTRAFFPHAAPEDLINPESKFRYYNTRLSISSNTLLTIQRKAHTSLTLHYWQDNKTQHTLKCIDPSTGQIVGMALWDIYLTPSDWRKPELSWLQGTERNSAEDLVKPLWDMREKLWLDERYLYCHVVAVHPDYQKKGIGKLLVGYGIEVARQAGLPVYVESSKDGLKLYDKTGFRRLREQAMPKEDGSDSATFMVAVPAGEETVLPEAVRLALEE
jgi:ribosomal protein S18 acetylase RimI-like enzyme